MNLKKTFDNSCRVVCTFHGVSIVINGIYRFTTIDFDLNRQNDYYENLMLGFSCAYFIYDNLVHLLIKKTKIPTVYLHHVVCALIYLSAYPHFGAFGALTGMFSGEVSNFFMHARKVLENEDLKYTLAYEICEVLYIVMYVAFRSIMTPIMIVLTVIAPNMPFLVPLGGCFVVY